MPSQEFVAKDLVALLSGYDIAFDAFITLLKLKTDFTHSLPVAVAGLASSDEVAGKSLALRLIGVFDSSRPDAHDRVASGYRHALQEWAHSDLPMSAVPQLHHEVAAPRFIPMVAWHAERPHGVMKKATTGKQAYGSSELGYSWGRYTTSLPIPRADPRWTRPSRFTQRSAFCLCRGNWR